MGLFNTEQEIKNDNGSTIPVSGTVTANTGLSQPLTDTQLRASAVPVTANAGTNLNTSALALDSTVAKDASLTTLNTSVNTLLKPANTLTKVATVDTITNPVTAAQGAGAAVTAGWPVISGQAADVTGTFTNATQTNSVTTGTITGYETVTVSINGTFGTATAVFEVSDDGGTTWYSTQGVRIDSATIEAGYTSLTNTTRMWITNIAGADKFRVRSTAVASGTVNVTISPTGASNANGATIQLGAALPTGTNTIGSVKVAGASGGTAEVNTRADGKAAIEVNDDMTSFEAQETTLTASTDTTITFAQTVRLVKVKNFSTSATVFVRDGAISSDTPTNSEKIGIAPATNVPAVEWFPFNTTTIHLRSAGTPDVVVTGFY